MRVLIAAGGTGGHIYPGIAVAKEILRRSPESKVRLCTAMASKQLFQAVLISLIDSAVLDVGTVGRAWTVSCCPRVLGSTNLIKAFTTDVVMARRHVSGPVV